MFKTWRLFCAGQYCAVFALLAQPVFALPSSLLSTGSDQMNRGNYKVAVNIFSAAVKNDPYDVAARRGLATALLNDDREREAIQQIMAVQQIQPGRTVDLCIMADAYNKLGKTDYAVQLYRQAMGTDSSCADARIGLARTLLSKGDLNSAKAICIDSIRNTRDITAQSQFQQILNLIKSRQYVQRVASNS